MEPQGCTWFYDQMDRHQRSTTKEISGELHHDWESGKASVMMQQMQVGCSVRERQRRLHGCVGAHEIITTPGPDSNDQPERICSQYVPLPPSPRRDGAVMPLGALATLPSEPDPATSQVSLGQIAR